MPIQSKRISLSALGIEKSPGLQPGNHLRIGFDSRMGFPPCGFNLFVRRHITGAKHAIDIPQLFTQKVPALLRNGYLQNGVSIFHPRKPLPVASPAGGILLTKQIVGISFRQSPFAPDSNPKVCEVRLRFISTAAVSVSAFDDRYDNAAFPKILVAHVQATPQVPNQAFDIQLRADLISLVEVSGLAGTRLLSIDYLEVTDTGWGGLIAPAEEPWQFFKEMPMLLPTPQPAAGNKSTYPTCTSLTFPPPADVITQKLPVSRLSSGFVPKTGSDDEFGEYPDLETHLKVYLGPEPDRQRFKELDSGLRTLESIPPGDQIDFQVTVPGEEPDESSTFSPLPTILTGSVDAHFARLAGLAMIHPKPGEGSHLDYKVVAKWNNIEHAWITHDVFPGRDAALNSPEPPDATPVLDATRPGSVKTNLELKWQAPGAIARLDRANQYASFHVFRTEPGAPLQRVRLTESKDELTGLTTPDLLLLAEVQGDEPVPATPADEAHYVDRPPAYAKFDYGIQAQDLFGRRSKIVWRSGVEIPVLIDPSAVSNFYAFYRDAADPAQADLEVRAQSILAATGQSAFAGRALLIEFRYPKASIDAIFGDVASFHISYRHGRPNEFLGLLAPPSIVGPPPAHATDPVLADVVFSSATPIPAAINGFGGERPRGALASGAEFFAIESVTALGPDSVRLRVRARRDYLPQPGEATLNIGGGNPAVTPHPLYLSPRDPAGWTGFDLRHPHTIGDQHTLAISASSNAVLGPLPIGLQPGQIVVSRSVVPPENAGPGESTAPQDWLYQIVVKDIDVPLPPGLSAYPGAVTAHVMSGANRRSELCAPAFVKRRMFGVPPLAELATAEFITATRPDFEERIGVWLTWPKVPGVSRFRVYRSDVPKLLSVRGADPLLAANLLESEPDRAQVKLLGGQLASIGAFILVTPVPIQPETDAADASRDSWVDRVSAPAGQNYVYRIQPVGPTGDEGTWPPDAPSDNQNRDRCVLVLQKNRDSILAPAIYALEPLDRAVGVVIRRPLSESITGLRLLKTDVPANAGDVRRMTLIHGTIPLTHARIQSLPAVDEVPALLRFVDEKVRTGVTYFYRVLFVDEFGNLSPASEPMAATPRSLAPPAPPALSATRTGPATVDLSWTAPHNEGQVKLQRKRSGESQWLDVTDWLPPTASATDTAAAGPVAHRLLLRDPNGRFIFSTSVVTQGE